MRKKYLRLTKRQKARGIIFSSVLVAKPGSGMIMPVREIKQGDPNVEAMMRRLKDDKIFNGGPFLYNLIRQ